MRVCNSVAAAAAGLVNVIALVIDCHARQRQKKIIMSWEMNHMQVVKARRRLSSKTRYLRRSPRPRGKEEGVRDGNKGGRFKQD